ncbi:hypothetical protein Q3G72_012990 [Acer saccharum]|nr:hypothetical protein Q3G72_012990 [Acer saccharum]
MCFVQLLYIETVLAWCDVVSVLLRE